MRHSLVSRIGLLALAATAVDCSGSPEQEPSADLSTIATAVTIPVHLVASAGASLPSNVRVALVWQRAFTFTDANTRVQTGHERIVGGDAVLGADGKALIELTEAPPTYQPHELEFVSSNVAFAEAVIFAYEDVNGNQQLDLYDYPIENFLDRVVAYNQDLRLVYAEGIDSDGKRDAVNRLFGAPVQEGFGIYYRERDAASPSPFAASPAYESLDRFGELAHRYELALAPAAPSDAKLAALDQLMCKTEPTAHAPAEYVPVFWEGRPFRYPQAEGEIKVVCADDGSWVEEWSCSTSFAGLCDPGYETCSVHHWSRLTPVPSDWPCP